MRLTPQYSLKSYQKLYIGFSGGVDSVAAAHFLNTKYNVSLVFIHHNTDNSESALNETVIPFSENYDLNLDIHYIDNIPVPKDESTESHWRNLRYKVFHNYDDPVITCHHLDDCVETWVWSSLHGNPRIIPYANKNVIRPFRMHSKQKFIDYANTNDLTWTEDSSNMDTKYIRNHIRHNMMNDVMKVNPGIHKTIRKKVINDHAL